VVRTEAENIMQKDFQEGGEGGEKERSRKGRAKSGTLPTDLRKDSYVHFLFFFFVHIEINQRR
jgi:hypothetical protein